VAAKVGALQGEEQMKRLWVTACCLVLAVAGCDDVSIDGDRIEGSGTIITESRSVSGFDAIEVFGSGDVVVEVTGTESLTITADDNIMPVLTSEVEGRALQLSIEPGNPLSPSQEIRYEVTVEELAAISIFGSADFDIAELDGSFEIDIAGSGDVTLVGSGDELTVDIKGSGDVDASGFVTERASVDIAGSGNVVVNATDELDVSVSGSGDVEYLGSPTVRESITGTGSVTPR
jgi:hypothetical protein